jgi:hypothetical protein
MPFALAAAGMAISGAVSAYGASKQSDAVNASSKQSARIAEENRVVGQRNLDNTLAAVGPRLEQAGALATGHLVGGQAEADAALRQGYGAAGNLISDAGRVADARLTYAGDLVGNGVQNANALLQPYVQTGQRALGMVGDLSGANGVDAGRAAMENFQYSPAYQFNLEQGLRGVDASASSRGMLTSGSTMAGAMKYASGLASNEFTNYYNRLSSLAGQGYTASQQSGANTMLGANQQAGFAQQQGATALNVAGSLAGNQANLGTGIANNAMTTGGRLATNDQTTAQNVGNLYTGNAQQGVNLGTTTAGNLGQLATSTGTAQANIYGNMSSGIGNAINSGMNNYMMTNALGGGIDNRNALLSQDAMAIANRQVIR